MKSVLLAVVAAAFFSSRLAAGEPDAGNHVAGAAVAAAPPRYVVLPAASGFGYFTPSDPPHYAYGWFGAQPRQTWFRHFGYYRNYTQWRVK